MESNTAQVKLEAVYGSLRSGMSQAKQILSDVLGGMKAELKDLSDQAKVESKNYEGTMEQFGNVVQNKFKGVNSAINGLKTAWAQLAVVIAAGMFAGKAVEEAVHFNTEAQKLARTLGITTNAATGLALAIGDAYGTTDQYLAAVKGLDRNLKNNEETMQSMGLVTRDANGELRNQNDLTLDALQLLRSYKDGTDRNIAAQALFGKGVDVSNEMLALSAERMQAGIDKAESLNLVVGTQSVEATNNYRAAMNDLDDLLVAVKVTIGNALMPAMTDLATFCSEVGPTAILALRIAINILIALFRGLALAVKVVWEVVTLAFKNMTQSATLFGEIFRKVMAGDFAGAAETGKSLLAHFAENAEESFGRIVDAAADAGSKTVDSFTGLLDKQGESGGGPAEGKSFTDPKAAEDARKAAEAAARKAASEAKAAAAEARRLAIDEFQAKMEIYKGEEQAAKGHWDKILDIQREELRETIKLYGEDSREATAMRNKILATERAAAEEHAKIEELKTQATRQAALARIDSEEQAAQAELAMDGITASELLAMQQDFENQRYQIKLEAAMAAAALAEQEPLKQQELYNQIEQMEQQHQLQLQKIREQSAMIATEHGRGIWQGFANNFGAALQGMLTKQMTFKQGMTQMWQSMYATFVQEMIVKPLQQWAMKLARDLIMHKANALQKNVIEKTQAASNISKSAAMAGAAGLASFAAAPWPIDMGAPAFGAAMSAAALAFMPGAAAEQGYDIPAGVNPVVQAHQKEMILPSAQADVIRSMADGGSAGSAIHIHVHSMDAAGVRRFLMDNKHTVAEVLRSAVRDGAALGVRR
jgi:hypothetical protein